MGCGARILRLLAGSSVLIALWACRTTTPSGPVTLPTALRDAYELAQHQERLARVPDAPDDVREHYLALALRNYRHVAEQAPEFFAACVRVQDVLQTLDPQEGERLYVEGMNPEDPAALTLAARWLMPVHLEQSIALLERALQRAPDFSWAHYGLAYANYLREDSQDALLQVARALELQSDLREAHRLRAALLEMEGQRDEALDAYRSLLEKWPAPATRHRYARVLLQSDDATDARRAERQLRRVLQHPLVQGAEHSDLRRDALLDLGVALSRQERGAEALIEFRHALALDPNLLPAYYNMAWVQQYLLAEDELALQTYEEYQRRAQEWQGEVPASFWFDRVLFVDRNIRELRRRLGRDPESGEVQEPEAGS